MAILTNGKHILGEFTLLIGEYRKIVGKKCAYVLCVASCVLHVLDAYKGGSWSGGFSSGGRSVFNQNSTRNS